jgi:hypothetical protein
MTSTELLVDAFGRIREVVPRSSTASHHTRAAGLAGRPRGQLDPLAGVAPDPHPRRPPRRRRPGRPGVDLTRLGGAIRIAVRSPGHRLRVPSRSGGGHAGGLRGAAVGYYDAVHQQTTRYVGRLGDADFAGPKQRSHIVANW